MANISDQLVGRFLMILSCAIFIYYTVWVVVLPFVDADHDIHKLFLPRMYAMALPIAAGALLILAIGAFVTIVMVGEAAKKRAKLSQQSQKKAQ